MKKITVSYLLTNVIFKLIPTILVIAYLWLLSSASVGELQTDTWMNIIVFSAGMVVSYLLYAQGVRFSSTFLILIGVIFILYNLIGASIVGEFDTFYHSVSFFIYGIIFVFGWLLGFGFARFTFFSWVMALIIFFFTVSLIVSSYIDLQHLVSTGFIKNLTAGIYASNSVVYRLFIVLISLFGPVLFYCAYLIFINEILRKYSSVNARRLSYLIRRSVILAGILVLFLLAMISAAFLFDFPEALYERLSDAESNSATFLKKTYNPTTNQPEFDLQDYAQLLPEVKLSDETVFCTYIDNFFPLADGSRIPLPVHFRRYVLNHYDPRNEKFVLDPYPPSAVPNDLFSPATRDVPIGFSVSDTTIENSTSYYDNRRDIAATVYVQALSPDAYVAPNTGYYYQKLPVPPEDRETFHTAYQCSSLISIYNLPQFVYSTNIPELAGYREAREEELRMDTIYEGLDSLFMAYYTRLDTADTVIMQLAARLTDSLSNKYDKLESILKYFTGTDENGKPNFTYSLSPGTPSNPEQSLLHYFLLENRKGYCTYFAGAMTLLLRAAGIPARLVVGYAIFDRSNKNSGWYWVYADQGHAWVEVYFPNYGWVDFDPTPTQDSEPSRPPRPDATPPEYVREPVFAVLGKITGISGDSTGLFIRPYNIRYRSKVYKISEPQSEIIHLKPKEPLVTIGDQKQLIGEFPLDRTMVLSSYSFDYDLEKIKSYQASAPFMEWFMQHFPEVIPVEEAIVVYQDESPAEGMIFAVRGQIQSILPDSAGLAIIPHKIFYRGKNYQLEPKPAAPINIQPQEAVIYIDDEKKSLHTFAIGDSMMVNAESGDELLHQIKPFLSTEPFLDWFRDSFPENIPVDRITLEVQKPPLSHQIAWGLLIALAAVGVFLVMLGMLVYLYLIWRIGISGNKQKPYWIYQAALMLLNQLGFHRAVSTPAEYATRTIDPQFDTQFGEFMSTYLKAKYSLRGLSPEEMRFMMDFKKQFNRKILRAYTKWDLMRSFANFFRTLRFLVVR